MIFAWLDFWYPDAWKAYQQSGLSSPELFCHGTSNYMDIALRDQGHESHTLIENQQPVRSRVKEIKPDVLISQNVGRWDAHELRGYWPQAKMIAFASYAAAIDTLKGWDCVFTSFPWMADELNQQGIRCEYLPLAFGYPVFHRIDVHTLQRDLPLTFVGGIGHRHIWQAGTDMLEKVAATFREFQWWGYRPKKLPPSLEKSWQGEAWGPDYFKLLARSKITLNRHGEIAGGCGNNMRQYEATAMGACLVTDQCGVFRPNVECMQYDDADDLMFVLRTLMDSPTDAARRIAHQGQAACLQKHCYENRVERFLEVIEDI